MFIHSLFVLCSGCIHFRFVSCQLFFCAVRLFIFVNDIFIILLCLWLCVQIVCFLGCNIICFVPLWLFALVYVHLTLQNNIRGRGLFLPPNYMVQIPIFEKIFFEKRKIYVVLLCLYARRCPLFCF